MKPVLRVATPADAANIRDVYAYYIENTTATFSKRLKTVEECRESIETLLETYPYLIAEDKTGRFLGFANGEPMRPQGGYFPSVELTIYLCPDAPKRAGIGKLLYETLLRILTEQGFWSAFGVVSASNRDSLAFHERLGFTEAARLTDVAYKHGQRLSVVWMRKELNPALKGGPAVIPFSKYRQGDWQ